MGNCFSKICFFSRPKVKPLIEIANIHKEKNLNDGIMLYVPIICGDEAHI
jgi:hypothetical protein